MFLIYIHIQLFFLAWMSVNVVIPLKDLRMLGLDNLTEVFMMRHVLPCH